MMILSTPKLLFAALLAALATPAFGAEPRQPAGAVRTAPASSESDKAVHSRRVELPFPIDFRSPDDAPPAPSSRQDTGPHPFREDLPKRASLVGPEAGACRSRRSPQAGLG